MNHDFFYREWNWIEQLSAAFHVFAANIKPILKVLLIVFLPISILESIINGRMLNAYRPEDLHRRMYRLYRR